MIVLVGSQKGGCGKSTIATNIAAALASKYDVLLVDSDIQQTSSRWIDERAETNRPVVHSVQKLGNITRSVKDLSARYDFLVIDAPGHDSQELRTGLLAANLAICPFRPSQADIDTAPALVRVIEQAGDFNPDLVVKAVLTLCPNNPRVTEINDTKAVLGEFIEVADSVIHDRKAFRDALAEGLGVTECGDEKAIAEITALVGVVCG